MIQYKQDQKGINDTYVFWHFGILAQSLKLLKSIQFDTCIECTECTESVDLEPLEPLEPVEHVPVALVPLELLAAPLPRARFPPSPARAA